MLERRCDNTCLNGDLFQSKLAVTKDGHSQGYSSIFKILANPICLYSIQTIDIRMKIPLSQIAYARSGDKGDGSNVGVVAYNEACYAVMKEVLTTDRVKEHFKEICFGKVDRYEADNLMALNFILHDSLGGGGSESLKTDAQGKTHGLGMLYMEIEVPDDFEIPQR